MSAEPTHMIAERPDAPFPANEMYRDPSGYVSGSPEIVAARMFLAAMVYALCGAIWLAMIVLAMWFFP